MAWDEAAWDALVADLYESAVDLEVAARLPARFAGLASGAVASMWELRPADLAVVGHANTTLPAEIIRAYESHYYTRDPWGPAVLQARLNTVLRGSEIIDDADLARTEYYNDFAAEHGMFHLIGALVPTSVDGSRTYGVISIQRPRQWSTFDDGAVAMLRRALPHIASAFRLRNQIVRADDKLRADALETALDAFGAAALVLDGHGTVMHANAQADAFRNTFKRRSGNGRALDTTDAARLRPMIEDAARGGAGGALRLSLASTDFFATVAPLPGRLAALARMQPGRVLVLLHPIDDTNGTPATQRLVQVFGLTRAEASAAALLADGLSPAEVARVRGVAVSTVRTQLQRAISKTGGRTLRDLVRLTAVLART